MLWVLSLFFSIAAAHSQGHENDLARFVPSAFTTALIAAASVSLNVTTGVDGQYVTASVNNPAFKPKGDFIAMYLADVDPTTTVPLKWTYMVPYIPSYPIDGTGNVTFQIYNVRAPIVFYLCTGSTSKPTLIASSPKITFDNDAPVRPRVLPGSKSGDFAIAWTTSESSATSSSPTLKYRVGGTPGSPLPNSVPATPGYVRKADLCGAPANTVGWMDLGATVTAQLPGLAATAAGKTVFYALTDSTHTSEEFSFVVPPLPGQGTYPFTFVAFGDLGRGSFDDGVTWSEYGGASKNTSFWLAKETSASFVTHFGDVSYAVGYLQTWDEYTWMASQWTSNHLYMCGYGNHESDFPNSPSWSYFGPAKDSGGECSIPTSTLYPLPAPASHAAPYYSFASGPVLVVVGSSEHDFSTGSAQLAWLNTTLAAADRTITPFILVTFHRPMYINSNFGPDVPTGDVNVMKLLQQYVEPITHDNMVTLMLYGHNHRLERISAAFAGEVVQASVPVADASGAGGVVHVYNKPKATVHYVAGSAGAAYSMNDCVSGGWTPCPAWSEAVVYEHGYLRLTALNATALRYDYVASINGTVIDSSIIIQDLSVWGA